MAVSSATAGGKAGKSTSAAQRRMVYGTNTVVQVLLALVVVVAVVYFAQRYQAQSDWTRSGLNSLTPRTKQLLRSLPEKVRISAIYTVLSEYDERAQKRQDRVRDLLALYEAAGRGKVTADVIDPMKNPAAVTPMLKRLRELPAYKDQAKPHEELLEAFPELSRKVLELIDQEAGQAEQMLAANSALNRTVVMDVSQELRRLQRAAADASQDIKDLREGEIPQFAKAVQRARDFLEQTASYFRAIDDWVQKRAATSREATPEVVDFLNGIVAQQKPLLTDIDAFVKKAEGLKPVELEELSAQLSRWSSAPPILVETDTQAAVVQFQDVWPFRSDRDGPPPPDGDERQFAGEQALSSAILKLTQKDKTAVIFTRFGGPSPIVPDFSQANPMMRQMPEAPYGTLNDLLGKENFITQDWDVQTTKEPPKVPDAKRTVYVVFPPIPPQQTDPRRPPPPGITPADVELITKAVNDAKMGLFLGGWQPPQGPPGMAPETPYAFNDYLMTNWGVQVRSDYIALPFGPSPEDPNLYLPAPEAQRGIIASGVLKLDAQPIAEPLRASPLGFDLTAPLAMPKVDGVKIEPVVSVADTTDAWALSADSVMHLPEEMRDHRGTYRRDSDLKPPFPIVVAAEKGDARLVVTGSSNFVSNSMLNLPGQYALSGSGIVVLPAFPGNPDLFINALHWLTKNADRISVGAQSVSVPRLDRLKHDGWFTFWRVFLVGLWPAMALVVGGGVWLVRRR